MLFSIHMAEGTLTAFETRAIGAAMTAETGWTNAIATGIADIPGPVLGELLSTTLTGNPHKRFGFKLILLCCKDKHFISIFQGFKEKKKYHNHLYV